MPAGQAVLAANARPERPRRKRRTQVERSAETRERVIRAATECIAELGYTGATMSEIAQRAGVTWGAMQHQFGDKDAIIDAVIERTLEEFCRHMDGLREAEPVLDRRVRGFAERAWEMFKGPAFRTMLQIVLHRREKTARMATVMTELWDENFGDLKLAADQQLAARRFTFVMLAGIATESAVVPGVVDSRAHFEVLERSLLGMLEPAGGRGRRAAAKGGRRHG